MIRCNPAQILKKHHDVRLNCSMASPSLLHVESIATEYIRNLILSKVPKDYFKTIYINEKHILDEYKRMDKSYNFLSKPKPALAITPRINYEFNNNDHNDVRFGSNFVIPMSTRLDTSFIKDYERNRFIGIGLELDEIEYNIKMLVDTKAKQMDLYKMLCINLPIGSTRQNKIDLDFHIPYYMMKQLATDIGMNIDTVEGCTKFLAYLNSKSELPILYKYRRANGLHEFFVRMRDFRIRLDMTDRISVDDGVVDNQTIDRFTVDFNIRVHIPAPKWYAYYSDTTHNIIESMSKSYDESVMISEITTLQIPTVNEKGWNTYLTVDYEQLDPNEDVVIDFTELFDSIHLTPIIKQCVKTNIDPRLFIDIKTFNSDSEYTVHMNWDTCIGEYDTKFKGITTYIALYLDTDFVHEQNIIREKLNETRIVDKH